MIVETRIVNPDKLRRVCIEKNWYTAGTEEEYENFLTGAKKIGDVTTADIVAMAEDILAHSEEEYFTLKEVCFYVAQATYNWFRDIEKK